jgi:hypothetical protein
MNAAELVEPTRELYCEMLGVENVRSPNAVFEQALERAEEGESVEDADDEADEPPLAEVHHLATVPTP